MNRLFFRSQDLLQILTDMKKYYGFDDTNIIYDLKENYASVLAEAHDVRQCCFNNRTKTVWKTVDMYDKFSNTYETNAIQSNRPIIIIEMYDMYAINPNMRINVIWRRSLGLEISISVSSNITSTPYIEYARPLFLHFLQWKYCCGEEMLSALQNFQQTLTKKGLTVYNIDCLQLSVSYYKNFKLTLC